MSSYNRRPNYNNNHSNNHYSNNNNNNNYGNNNGFNQSYQQRNNNYDYSNRYGRSDSRNSGGSGNNPVCTFYSKIGACRHGSKCSRSHIKPETSKVVCLLQMYDNPRHIRGLRKMNKEDGEENENENENENEVGNGKDKDDGPAVTKEESILAKEQEPEQEQGSKVEGEEESDEKVEKEEEEDNLMDTSVSNDLAIFANEMSLDEEEIQKKIDTFYKDVFIELSLSYGKIQDLIICENVNNHLSGNVYVKFQSTEDSSKCVESINDKWYNGRPVFGELSPVINLEDAICRAYENGECDRGGLCNFMHAKNPSGSIKSDLLKSQEKYYLNK